MQELPPFSLIFGLLFNFISPFFIATSHLYITVLHCSSTLHPYVAPLYHTNVTLHPTLHHHCIKAFFWQKFKILNIFKGLCIISTFCLNFCAGNKVHL